MLSVSSALAFPSSSAAPVNTSDELSPVVIFRLTGKLLITGTNAVPLLPCEAGCIAFTAASFEISLTTAAPLISRAVTRSV